MTCIVTETSHFGCGVYTFNTNCESIVLCSWRAMSHEDVWSYGMLHTVWCRIACRYLISTVRKLYDISVKNCLCWTVKYVVRLNVHIMRIVPTMFVQVQPVVQTSPNNYILHIPVPLMFSAILSYMYMYTVIYM